ncbi:hypothetical protein TSAR_005979 [Trichomalopsis sarcophagae]|uniref:Uncharacterized protein n=1 Tax=Trichomalopsis sarcophagae TaxID=543379 RepID=A0A232FE97_9HYME|nr:hypothetical protein TSAR_005979 [Trichomalopsis sarcophagae]
MDAVVPEKNEESEEAPTVEVVYDEPTVEVTYDDPVINETDDDITMTTTRRKTIRTKYRIQEEEESVLGIDAGLERDIWFRVSDLYFRRKYIDLQEEGRTFNRRKRCVYTGLI